MSANYIECKVMLTNKNSQLNKKLIRYFVENLDYLNKNRYVFDWVIVYPEEIDIYKEQGYTKFPLLLINDEEIFGINSIIDYLENVISEPAEYIPNEDDMHTYMAKALNSDNMDDIDENDEFSKNIQKRMTEMNKARNKSGQHTVTSSMSNPEIHEKKSKSSFKTTPSNKKVSFKKGSDSVMDTVNAITDIQDKDDELMKNYWENNLES